MVRRNSWTDTLAEIFQRGERWLIRGLVLASALLVLFQLGSAQDPVQFYLAMAQKVESPALPIGTESDGNQYSLTLKVTPSSAPVKLIQNDQIIAALNREETTEVKVTDGELIFDGRGIGQTVKVQILTVSPEITQLKTNQVITLQNNALSINITPKQK